MQVTKNGGRTASRAAILSRAHSFERDRLVTRKELAQTARECEKALDLRPAVRLVLHELVACWGEQQLEGRIIVWPSNELLVEKTGLSERSVRYAIKALIELQVLRPKDSANGKRFAIKNSAGQVLDAFGFDLAPLYARRDEFIAAMTIRAQEKEARKRAFDDLTIMRRACVQIATALLETDKGAGERLVRQTEELARTTPRRGSSAELDAALEAWLKLKEEAEILLMNSGCGGKNSSHIETDNEFPSESCNKAPENGVEAQSEKTVLRLSALRLDEIADGLPILSEYGLDLTDLKSVVLAARQLRPALGMHQSAWTEAVENLGLEAASLCTLYVVQCIDDDNMSGANRIKNPGGYFRAMARLVAGRKINLIEEIAALRKRKSKK